MKLGTLYLIPVTLGENTLAESIPVAVQKIAATLDHFIAEEPKTARAFLKNVGTLHEIRQIHIDTLNEHSKKEELLPLLAPLMSGKDVGLLSEAGCPGIADPGADLVHLAHQKNIPVRPLVGPSSILLALMASGTTGQQFAFHGYLPIEASARKEAIQKLEKQSYQQKEAEIFIETPYRNQQMLETLISTCRPTTHLTIACNLTLPEEKILSLPIKMWAKTQIDLHKKPCVFVLYAGN